MVKLILLVDLFFSLLDLGIKLSPLVFHLENSRMWLNKSHLNICFFFYFCRKAVAQNRNSINKTRPLIISLHVT